MAPKSPVHAANLLASQFSAVLQRTIRQQRSYVEHISEQTIRDGSAQGFIELGSDGEIVATVEFPIAFAEKPLFTTGLELADDAWLTYGAFPIWSASVSGWITQKTPDSTLYIGAELGIVVIGPTHTILHYSFQGRSFTAPTGGDLSVGSPL